MSAQEQELNNAWNVASVRKGQPAAYPSGSLADRRPKRSSTLPTLDVHVERHTGYLTVQSQGTLTFNPVQSVTGRECPWEPTLPSPNNPLESHRPTRPSLT